MLILYILIILFIILFYFFREKFSFSSDNYLVYGRSGKAFEITSSIVAMVFGASSVFGLAGYGYIYGWNAIWWTLSGSIFLIVLSLTFTKVLINSGAYTIIDIIEKSFGKEIKVFVSFIFILAWLFVLSGQIIAGGSITAFIIKNEVLAYIVFSLIFFSYTFIFGQVGTLKTGFFQVFLMLIGLVLLFCFMFVKSGSINLFRNVEFGINSKFNLALFLNIFIPVGLSYLFGPDIYTRILSSKDEKTARISLISSSIIIFLISVIIVSIGILARNFITTQIQSDKIIPFLTSQLFNGITRDLVIIALISIPLSGADAILLNLSTVAGKDLILVNIKNKDDKMTINAIRLSMFIILIISVLISLRLKEIISSLLIAYKIFACGVVPLIFVSILAMKFSVVFGRLYEKLIIGFYLVLAALSVLLIELKVLKLSIPYFSLILTIFNILVLLILFSLKLNSLKKKV